MQLGWIDFSQEDRKKVLDVINLLQEPGAVDEIGIGLIRDAFANLFFPGTSTVQTIAKYFLIVPYILKEATEGRYGNDLGHILRRIDQEEKVCGIRLMHMGKDQGRSVVGQVSSCTYDGVGRGGAGALGSVGAAAICAGGSSFYSGTTAGSKLDHHQCGGKKSQTALYFFHFIYPLSSVAQ